jgi:hypothetical protein
MGFQIPVAIAAALSLGSVAVAATSVSNAASPIPASAATTVTLSGTLVSTAIGAPTAEPMLRVEPAVFTTDRGLSLGTSPLPQPSMPQLRSDSSMVQTPAASLSTLVDRHDDDLGNIDQQMRCLATAVFYEARSESLAGKLAVARVVINRADSGRFPTSLCGVVTQPGQFSFVRGGQLPSAPITAAAWADSVAIARVAVEDGWESVAEGALYFHASRVSPGWGRPRLAKIDNHIFYR